MWSSRYFFHYAVDFECLAILKRVKLWMWESSVLCQMSFNFFHLFLLKVTCILWLKNTTFLWCCLFLNEKIIQKRMISVSLCCFWGRCFHSRGSTCWGELAGGLPSGSAAKSVKPNTAHWNPGCTWGQGIGDHDWWVQRSTGQYSWIADIRRLRCTLCCYYW